jgi:hypothetical protein
MTMRTHDEYLSKKRKHKHFHETTDIHFIHVKWRINGGAEKNFQRESKILFRKSASTGNPAPHPTRTATARPSLRHSRASGNPVRTLRRKAPHPLISGPSGRRQGTGFPLARE